MLKVVVYTILASACILIMVLSQKIKPNIHEDNSLHGALSRRFGYPIFDPLVAKLERAKEEKRNDNRGRRDAPDEDSKYFSDEERLNITLRLMYLFPALDTSPADGMIDYKELEALILQQAIDRLHYRTLRELELHDKDGDRAVSFSEYFPRFTVEDIERNDTEHGGAGWWMEQFRNADTDRNGNLNLYEFRDFLYPEDSKSERVHKWLLREKIRQMDKNNDQQLSLAEFEVGAYSTYKSYVEFETGNAAPDPVTIFSRLDLNKDSLLRVEELKPLIQYLAPGELAYARYYTRYLIKEADGNEDGRLTLDEMIEHDHVFYNAMYDHGRSDENSYDYHDEL